MLVSIGDLDLTPYINQKTYKMNTEKTYESWLDGNYREHRIYTVSKVRGSFEVCIYGQPAEYGENMTTERFLNTWNNSANNEVIRLGVYVQNTGTVEAIDAYFEFEGTFHREMINGNYCDKLKIIITER